MSRGRHLAELATPSLHTHPGTRVSLFGGPADGRIVKVQFLEDAAAVYQTRAGRLVALAADAPAVGAHFLGVYEFVGGPRGPERPVCIHRAGAARDASDS